METVYVTEDAADPTNSAVASATPVLLADSNLLNDTTLLKKLPVPINSTMNTTDGIFKFSYDTPANLSAGFRNGTRHDFRGGRNFIYTPEIEIDANIEINIIVQEFCDICTDRSNTSDFQLFTIVHSLECNANNNRLKP